MICNKDCFNCKYDDCIRSERADKAEYNKEWRELNPERFKQAQRRYRSTHKDVVKGCNQRSYDKVKDDPEYKAKSHERYLKRKNSPGYKEWKKENNRRYRESLRERQAV